MGVRGFLTSTRTLFHVSSKPSREEYFILMKISLIGLALIGGVGFTVKILFWFVGLLP